MKKELVLLAIILCLVVGGSVVNTEPALAEGASTSHEFDLVSHADCFGGTCYHWWSYPGNVYCWNSIPECSCWPFTLPCKMTHVEDDGEEAGTLTLEVADTSSGGCLHGDTYVLLYFAVVCSQCEALNHNENGGFLSWYKDPGFPTISSGTLPEGVYPKEWMQDDYEKAKDDGHTVYICASMSVAHGGDCGVCTYNIDTELWEGPE